MSFLIRCTDCGHTIAYHPNDIACPKPQKSVTRGMGQGAHDNLKQAGIQPILTDIHEIEPALQAYIEGTLSDHPERLH